MGRKLLTFARRTKGCLLISLAFSVGRMQPDDGQAGTDTPSLTRVQLKQGAVEQLPEGGVQRDERCCIAAGGIA